MEYESVDDAGNTVTMVSDWMGSGIKTHMVPMDYFAYKKTQVKIASMSLGLGWDDHDIPITYGYSGDHDAYMKTQAEVLSKYSDQEMDNIDLIQSLNVYEGTWDRSGVKNLPPDEEPGSIGIPWPYEYHPVLGASHGRLSDHHWLAGIEFLRVPLSMETPLTDFVGDVSIVTTGKPAFYTQYQSWDAADSLGAKVGAFVIGAGNFLAAMGVPPVIGTALMGVLVASFAGTTLDTATRLQRYVVQELAGTFARKQGPARVCLHCDYDLTDNVSGTCPECGWEIDWSDAELAGERLKQRSGPLFFLTNKHGATIFAIVIALALATLPAPGAELSWAAAGTGGMILWPMFGATNQLLGGLAFLVIAFYLLRRKKPVWFLVLPLVFMLIVPAWAMVVLLTDWLGPAPDGGTVARNWPLIIVAVVTVALEVWMVIEAALLWPKVRRQMKAMEQTAG